MGYSNSSLVAYTLLSPNHSGLRTEQIDRISPHCVVGQCTAEGLGDWFHKSSTQASSNYGIDRNGRVGLYVEEKNRSWCTSSNANDQRAVTIECASDKAEPYAMHQVVYDRLVDLCEDICRRNGKKKLLWFGDKNKSLNYQPKADEMLITVHRWFANKSCPGDWLYARLGDLAAKVTSRLGSGNVEVISSGMQAGEFQGLTEEQVLAKVGSLFTADQKKSGILASVSMAQFILESGYGKSELALGANNCFGMKKSLSGNTWSGSVWDGVSIYKKKTQEQKADGSYVTVTAEFRKYANVEDSIADHSAYLLGAKNGEKLRYDGLKGCSDYKKAVQIIKDGGYATSLTYVEKLCGIIERWNLTKWDVKNSGASDVMVKYYRVKNPYKVGKQSYKELKSQGSGLSNIEITDGNIKSFERVAKKYRLDFALKKDSSTKPPTYYVFFKGQDTEMMNLAFKKYLGVQMNKKDKPSIMKKLMHFKDAVSKGKNRERAREQQKDRGQSL